MAQYLIFKAKYDKEESDISTISLVKGPAIFTNFIAFGNVQKRIQFAVAEEGKIVSPILIPDLKIFRTAEQLGTDLPGFTYFDAETIEEIAHDHNNLKSQVSLNHEKETTDSRMVENWIVRNPDVDMAAHFGISVPKSTWMGMWEIDLDSALWKDVKAGKYDGVSVEFQMALDFEGTINLSRVKEDSLLVDFENNLNLLLK